MIYRDGLPRHSPPKPTFHTCPLQIQHHHSTSFLRKQRTKCVHEYFKVPDTQVSTHVFKVVDGLSLSIDVSKLPSASQNGIVLLHFHGGFLVHFQAS